MVPPEFAQWRDPDSNRGHHDFQSWTEITLTMPKVLQFRGFALSAGNETKSAICVLFARIQAPERRSVPKRCRSPGGAQRPVARDALLPVALTWRAARVEPGRRSAGRTFPVTLSLTSAQRLTAHQVGGGPRR
jgi:hypothetical protein